MAGKHDLRRLRKGTVIRSVIADVQKAGYHVAQIQIDKDALVSI